MLVSLTESRYLFRTFSFVMSGCAVARHRREPTYPNYLMMSQEAASILDASLTSPPILMESRKPMLPWMDAVRSSRSCEWEQCDSRERPLARALVHWPVSRRDGGGARDRRAVAYRLAGLGARTVIWYRDGDVHSPSPRKG